MLDRDSTHTSTIRWTTTYCEKCKERTTWWLVNDRVSRCAECDTERDRGQGLALDSDIFRDEDLDEVRGAAGGREKEGSGAPPAPKAKIPSGLELDSKIFHEDEEAAARKKAEEERRRNNPLGLDLD